MINRLEAAEAFAITGRLMAALMNFAVSADAAGAALRMAVGKLIANFYQLVREATLGTEMAGCFDAARAAGATLVSMEGVRAQAMAEVPRYNLGNAVANAGVVFSFAAECQIITLMTFASRSQVDALMDQMTAVIEDIKLGKSNALQVNDYRNVVALSALLFQHLSATERQLPRIVAYHFADNMTALTLANRIYGEGGRFEELLEENKTVHPAFMQRDIKALSA